MNLRQKCVSLWGRAPVVERERFLRILQREIPKASWASTSSEDLAAIEDFELLPSELKARLLMSVTEGGFSLERYRRSHGVLVAHLRRGHTRKEAMGK